MAQGQPRGSGHIIDHLNLELLLYIHVLGYVKGTLRGHCSAECVDGSIIFNTISGENLVGESNKLQSSLTSQINPTPSNNYFVKLFYCAVMFYMANLGQTHHIANPHRASH